MGGNRGTDYLNGLLAIMQTASDASKFRWYNYPRSVYIFKQNGDGYG